MEDVEDVTAVRKEREGLAWQKCYDDEYMAVDIPLSMVYVMC